MKEGKSPKECDGAIPERRGNVPQNNVNPAMK